MLQPRVSSARELEESRRSPVPVPVPMTSLEVEFPFSFPFLFPLDLPCCATASDFEVLLPRQEI